MDVDLLSKMIRELILDSDEVTLPGIGTFVTEIIPATFSDKGYTINPPYRRLFFRERIDGGEDALIDFYASSNDIPKEQASKIITDFLTGMMGVLREKKAVIFPGLGRLRATKEDNLFFVADEDLDIWPAGFGLEPISLKTHVETAEEVGAAVSSLRSILDAPQEKSEAADNAAEETEVVAAPSASNEASEIASEVAASPEATSGEEAAIAEAAAEPEMAEAGLEVAETEPEVVETEPEVAEAAPEESQETTVQPKEDAIEEEPCEESQPPMEKEEEQPAHDAPEPKRGVGNGVKIILWTLLVLAILLAAYVIAGHMGLLDKLLYSPEELEFMRQGGL